MNDERIKSLFDNFEPDLSSDARFIDALQHRLNSVEIVKQHVAEVKRRNKRAMTIAACVGFIVGFLFAMALPRLTEIVGQWLLLLPGESWMNVILRNFTIIAWSLTAGASVLATLNTYKYSLAVLSSKKDRTRVDFDF